MVYIGSVIGAGLPQVCTRGGCADGSGMCGVCVCSSVHPCVYVLHLTKLYAILQVLICTCTTCRSHVLLCPSHVLICP